MINIRIDKLLKKNVNFNCRLKWKVGLPHNTCASIWSLVRGALFKFFLFNFMEIKMDIHNKFNDLNSIEKI